MKRRDDRDDRRREEDRDRDRDNRDRDRDRGRDYRERDYQRDREEHRERDRDGDRHSDGKRRGSGGGRPLTCYICQQSGHGARDCPQKKPKLRDDLVEVERDDENLPGGDEPGDVQARIKMLLVRIGEKGGQDLEKSIEMLSDALVRDLPAHNEWIVACMLDCAKLLPTKPFVYSTVSALMARQNVEFATTLVSRLEGAISGALQVHADYDSKLLIRFAGALAVCNVIKASDVLSFLNSYIQCIDDEKLDHAHSDLILHSVVGLLPWVGSELSNGASGEEFSQLLETIDALMRGRPLEVNHALRVFHWERADEKSEDLLSSQWRSIKALQAASWKTTSMWRPHTTYESMLSTLAPVKFSIERIPKQKSDNPLRLRPDLRLYPSSLGHGKDVAEYDRLLCCEHISDSLVAFETFPKEGAKQLLFLPVQFNYQYLIVETMFSHMLALPDPVLKSAYYVAIMVYLFKAEPKKFPPLLGQAVNSLFERMDSLEVECRDRLTVWFAQHLSNFNFAWPWAAWANTLNELDGDSPKKIFVRELLERETRLAYWDRINTTLDGLKLEMPPTPDPVFPYEKKGDSDMASTAAALTVKLRDKIPSAGLVQYLEAAVGTDNISRLRLLWPCLLNSGSKSFSHMTALLERYRDALKSLSADMDSQAFVVQALGDFWKNSTLHLVTVMDKLVTSHILSPGPVVRWIFTQTQYPQHRQFLWEVLHNTVEKTVLRAERAKAQAMDEKEDLAAAVQTELRELFVSMFRHFQKALSDRLAIDQDEMSHAYSHLASRLVQFGRMFYRDLQPFRSHIERNAFPQDVDERITNLFHISQDL